MTSYLDDSYTKNYSLESIESAAHIFSIYLKSINGVDWGFVLTPRENNVTSLSFRSLPNSVSSRQIPEEMNIGGGHDGAAGGKINLPPKQALENVIFWMKKNKPRILQ